MQRWWGRFPEPFRPIPSGLREGIIWISRSGEDQIARYGLTVADVQDVIVTAIGGKNITYTVEGLERYPVNLRYGRELRDNIDLLKGVLVTAPTGAHIPLGQLAFISIHKGPAAIKTENSRPTAWIYVDLKGVDVGTYVENAKGIVSREVKLPTGYSLVWSGQYEYMEKARKTLNLVVPLTLVVIFVLLYIHFHSFSEAFIVMASLPFALVGGVWLLYLLDYNLSVAVVVGFIALAGLAAENGGGHAGLPGPGHSIAEFGREPFTQWRG